MPRAPKKATEVPAPVPTTIMTPEPPKALELDQLQHMRASVNLSTVRTNPEGEQRFFYVTRENQVGWLATTGEHQEQGYCHGLEANQAFHRVVKSWEEGK